MIEAKPAPGFITTGDVKLPSKRVLSLLVLVPVLLYLLVRRGDNGNGGQPAWDNGYLDSVDKDLFRRALALPSEQDALQAKAPPKVAFLFLVRGPIPLEAVWQRFFQGHEGRYSVYVHASTPDFNLDASVNSSIFKRRQIPSVKITWGGPNLIRAERRLLAAALADPSNQRFVLLSEACLPLFNFTHVYDYLFAGNKSFITSHPSSWRYRRSMAPLIKKSQFRKGSQWFALTRRHAAMVVDDVVFYDKFVQTNAEIPDESYIQTILSILDGVNLEPRGVLYVHWFTSSSEHPMSYGPDQVTRELITALQTSQLPPAETVGFLKVSRRRPCTVAGQPTHCFLFARKFPRESVWTFLTLKDVIGF